MVGFPPPAEKIVTRQNQNKPEYLRWSQTHARMLAPTAVIRRGNAPVSRLPEAEKIAIPSFKDSDGSIVDYSSWMRRTHADALIILHNGRIVFEGYAPGVSPDDPHTLQSVTKSFTGLAAAILIEEKKIDPNAPLARYVPPLDRSAWRTATVQQTLDMLTAVQYDEDLKNPNSDVFLHYGVAAGTSLPPPGYDGPLNLYEMLQRLPQTGEHGKAFTYKTVNPEAAAWAVSRVTGVPLVEYLSQRIWRHIGAEQDAYVTVDPAGKELAGSGMSATARDLARFGEMLRLGGRFNGQQIVPRTVVEDLFRGGDREKFRKDPLHQELADYSYHNFWWHPPAPEVIVAVGGFGQRIHINRRTGTVIVKFSSSAIPTPYEETKRLDALGCAAIDALFQNGGPLSVRR